MNLGLEELIAQIAERIVDRRLAATATVVRGTCMSESPLEVRERGSGSNAPAIALDWTPALGPVVMVQIDGQLYVIGGY